MQHGQARPFVPGQQVQPQRADRLSDSDGRLPVSARRHSGGPMKRLDRRTLLRGAGGAALALPLLEIMMKPRTATATPVTAPRRIMFVFQANGDEVDARFTAPGETTFQLGEFLAPLE